LWGGGGGVKNKDPPQAVRKWKFISKEGGGQSEEEKKGRTEKLGREKGQGSSAGKRRTCQAKMEYKEETCKLKEPKPKGVGKPESGLKKTEWTSRGDGRENVRGVEEKI